MICIFFVAIFLVVDRHVSSGEELMYYWVGLNRSEANVMCYFHVWGENVYEWR